MMMDNLKPLASSELGHKHGLYSYQLPNQEELKRSPRLTQSEGTGLGINYHMETIPFVNNTNQHEQLSQKVDYLNKCYEEMSMAIINMQCTLEELQKSKTKLCPICMDDVCDETVHNKLAYFDCGHWICQHCMINGEANGLIAPLDAEWKQQLLVHLLVEKFKQSQLVECDANQLNLNVDNEQWSLHFDSRVHLYRDGKNNVTFRSTAAAVQQEDQKPALESLFDRTLYVIQCPICKSRACHSRKTACYKLVYF